MQGQGETPRQAYLRTLDDRGPMEKMKDRANKAARILLVLGLTWLAVEDKVKPHILRPRTQAMSMNYQTTRHDEIIQMDEETVNAIIESHRRRFDAAVAETNPEVITISDEFFYDEEEDFPLSEEENLLNLL